MPDAWNPAGGNAKAGNGMLIPFSDKERADNDWFADAYGTVTMGTVTTILINQLVTVTI